MLLQAGLEVQERDFFQAPFSEAELRALIGDRSPADDGPARGGGTDVSDTLPPPQTPRGDDDPPTYVAPFKLTHPDLRRKPGPLAPVISWCPATLKRAPAGLS